jgi:hypothetical protein
MGVGIGDAAFVRNVVIYLLEEKKMEEEHRELQDFASKQKK